MAKAPREHLSCTECDWYGVTTQGQIRRWVYRLSSASIAVMVWLSSSELSAFRYAGF